MMPGRKGILKINIPIVFSEKSIKKVKIFLIEILTVPMSVAVEE